MNIPELASRRLEDIGCIVFVLAAVIGLGFFLTLGGILATRVVSTLLR